MNGLGMYLLFLIPPLILGLWAQRTVNSRFRTYSQQPNQAGMTGAQVARAILDRNGLSAVPVAMVGGELTDHYDPRKRTVNLSESVYGVKSVASLSVAAHEVGHAIQHQRRYVPMTFRSALAPVAQFGSSAWQFLLMAGFLLMFLANNSSLGVHAIQVGLALYSFAVLFHIVTLPVEFNASRRARRQLDDLGLVSSVTGEAVGVRKVLGAAAMTYVAGALAAAMQLIYYAMMFLGRDD